MSKMSLRLLLGVAMLGLASAAVHAQDVPLVPERPAEKKKPSDPGKRSSIRAWVGRRVITDHMVREAIGPTWRTLDPDSLRQRMLGGTLDLIEEAAVEQEAKKLGLVIPERFVERLIRDRFGSRGEYEQTLVERGLTRAEDQDYVGREIMRGTYLGARAGFRSIGEAFRSVHYHEPAMRLVREIYDLRQDEFRVQARAHVKLMTISRSTIKRTQELADDAAFDAWLAKLEEDLATGADFDLLRGRYDPDRGDEDWQESQWVDEGSALNEAIVEAALKMPVGTSSSRLGSGSNLFFFVHVIERQEARQIPFGEAQAQIREGLKQQAIRQATILEELAILRQAYIRPNALRELVLERKRRQLASLNQ